MTTELIGPDRIYLQLEDHDWSEVVGDVHVELTTWCEDRINDTDCEYVRAALVDKMIAEATGKDRRQFAADVAGVPVADFENILEQIRKDLNAKGFNIPPEANP